MLCDVMRHKATYLLISFFVTLSRAEMNKKILASISAIAILAVSVLTVALANNAFELSRDNQVGTLSVAEAASSTHQITIEAVEMPDGMFAYRMVEHLVDGDDITNQYSPKPSIPGPTIVMTVGDDAFVTLVNSVSCDMFPDDIVGDGREVPSIAKIGIHVHGVHYMIDSDGTPKMVNKIADQAAACGGESITYHWIAAEGTQGSWPYHDHTFTAEHGAEGLGLFGTVIVNPDQNAQIKVGVNGKVQNVKVSDISKEYVLWMTSTEVLGKSLFYGMEIDNHHPTTPGKQTPLWVNPLLLSTEGEFVRFHVLGMGDEVHSFHLHAHRWIEPGSESQAAGKFAHLIDVEEIVPLDHHVFVTKAGEGVGPGDWMYHCHVLRHMEEGMSGMFRVLPEGSDDTLPTVGAVFTLTDEPGWWFKAVDRGIVEALDGTLSDGIGWPLSEVGVDSESRSVAVIRTGESVLFTMKDSVTLHTVTSLIFPENAVNMPFDKQLMLRGSTFITDTNRVPVTLDTAGLYVFVCKIHPYMLGAVIADNDGTLPLELGTDITVATRTGGLPGNFPTTVPTTDPLAANLLRTFFAITDRANWKDYTTTTWNINLPDLPIDVTGDGATDANLGDFDTPVINPSTELFDPVTDGVGEVWVNTQFELTMNKQVLKRESLKAADASPIEKPGTITVVDAANWSVTKKIALPEISMNHPHNMWADEDEDTIYQTQWFDRRLVAIDRATGEVVRDIAIGQSPSHVMTSPVDDKIYIAMNGEEQVLEIDPLTLKPTRQLSTGVDSHPHGHWISTDGQFIVTPNFFALDGTGGSAIFDLDSDEFIKVNTGQAPIAIGMIPNDSIYYTADFLGNSLTKVDADPNGDGNIADAAVLTTIDLLAGAGVGLPIQTPVSPDGKWVVTANTLGAKISVVDTSTDTVVKVLDCDPGCHGVNFGEKSGGGFYAYVTNKFSNAMIIVDPDPNNDNDASDAAVVGKVLLADSSAMNDDRIVGLEGMGGQGVLPLPIAYPGWT